MTDPTSPPKEPKQPGPPIEPLGVPTEPKTPDGSTSASSPNPTEPEPQQPKAFKSADPRAEHWDSLAYQAPDQVVTEIRRLVLDNRARIQAVNGQLPRDMSIDWVATEAEIRQHMLLEHVLPEDSPERLLYELHVMREFAVFTDQVVERAKVLAEQRAAAEARQTLMQGVGIPIPGGSLPGQPPNGGRPIRERPSHFGG